ncbi:GDSL family lipase [Sphingomonas yunnanensis]|uniref:GDSL-type esterase/lipase family protein n=1 Tax=Sphingomonas yunnanensis TaxID=310400 RepID=UPI001CA730DC|nr:GDSL-type esterase/lipase family protein [Sphingomonas yunnanensis]MBY9065174.1 GDSL family lipase [Sphingomonas yunnanensis]
MRHLNRLLLGVAGVLTVLHARSEPKAAEPIYQSSPERRTVPERDWGPWLGPFRARLVPSLMQDFGERYIYAERNRKLHAPRVSERRVVFLGDSITDRWDLAGSFPGRPYVNRGIGSQVTSQLVLRFHQDVVSLRAAVVVVLAGVNDVQGFLQQERDEQIQANWETLGDLADRHGIAAVFGSLLPVNGDTPAAGNVLRERDPARLRRLNDWLQAFCLRRGYVYADYYAVMVDKRGLMRHELTQDGIHPLRAGYALMATVADGAIRRALSQQQREVGHR